MTKPSFHWKKSTWEIEGKKTLTLKAIPRGWREYYKRRSGVHSKGPSHQQFASFLWVHTSTSSLMFSPIHISFYSALCCINLALRPSSDWFSLSPFLQVFVLGLPRYSPAWMRLPFKPGCLFESWIFSCVYLASFISDYSQMSCWRIEYCIYYWL